MFYSSCRKATSVTICFAKLIFAFLRIGGLSQDLIMLDIAQEIKRISIFNVFYPFIFG
jgi:hypothetical protein